MAPIPTISLSDTTLNANETALVTINFGGSYAYIEPEQLTSQQGIFTNLKTSDEGLTWTANFVPKANISTANSTITLASAVQGGATSAAFTVDTVAPTAVISMDDIDLTTGETTVVHVNFSEQVVGVTSNVVVLPNGSLSAFSSSDGGISWSATFTPNANVDAPSNNVGYRTQGITDLAGNSASGFTLSGFDQNGYYAINTTGPAPGPRATILIDDAALTAGEEANVIITFTEMVRNFDNADVTVGSGSLSTLTTSDEGLTWTGKLTPAAGVESGNNVISVNLAGLTGASSGLSGAGSATSSAYVVDTKLPTATIVVADDALNIGDDSLVTISFSEAVEDFTNADLQVEGGTLSNVVMTDEGIGKQWSAVFTPSAAYEGSGKHITLDYSGVKDVAGNSGVGTVKSNAYAVDTLAPTATLSIADTSLTKGEQTTITVTFSEKVNGLYDYNVNTPGGSLSSLATGDGGKTWTGTFTPADNFTSQTNTLSLNGGGIYDLAGNAFGHVTSHGGYYAIDTTTPPPAPTATIVVDDADLKLNETAGVTITFSQAVRNFDNTDVSVGGGTLSTLTSNDEGVTWHGTLTPAAGLQGIVGRLSVDLSGVTAYGSNVAGVGRAESNPYWIDTKGPSATVVVADSALTAGETSLVTISFSEYVNHFDAFDLKAENGTLGALTTSDEGRTWHTTFTPSVNVNDSTNVVSLNMGGLTDSAGNPGVGIIQSNNYAVNTAPPVVVTPPPAPTQTVTVDGVAIRKTTGTAADGSTTQIITVPTVTTGRVDKDGTVALADIPLAKAADGTIQLSLGVPLGFGVQASGSATAKSAGDSLANLIAEIEAHTSFGSQSQKAMTGGGAGFLGSLDASTPLLVQTIAALAPTGTDVSTGAMVISGSTVAGSPQTALVIDTRALPAGATIELQNVDFAAIVGAVSLRGGDGKQVVFGDGASQNIFLGADDDILHGGAGNDIVGSAGGNDQIFGDEGDDIVFGGAGDDIIDGGAGYDIVRLEGASRAEYSFRVNDGKLVMTHLNGGIDGTDIVSNVEALRFAGASSDIAFRDTDVASLVRMYDTIFDRHADEAGLNFWIGQSEAGMSLHDIAVAMATSTEAQARYQGVSDADFIGMLYLQGLERSGTAQESAFWIEALENGVISRGDALLGFADSAEMIALVGMMDTSIVTA